MRVKFSEIEEDIMPFDNVIEIKDFWYSYDQRIAFSNSKKYFYISKDIITKNDFDNVANCLLKNGFADLDMSFYGGFELKRYEVKVR